ncbi:peptidoglycan recognition protein family protein [Companilactobacillus keshanensis]|uniref:N-acetylmuramoyl-L-alanine amidase family protein n=1 Tax=Companilactobacillus keshanensis TaxID=2486003 RepID=A0ABW4BTV9_9LACO|nr:N-acetylmuramoyl-L-alanine amidase [Companilactobacillus keshanensis]
MKKGKVLLSSVVAILLGVLFISFGGLNTKADTINSYILGNKIQPAEIQYREGTFSHWFGYENGVGKPEGVVVHETADANASAENEVSYFNNNWPSLQTYVHAFVDDKESINIHSADYGVWGAGHTANYKFIQVELCEVHDYDAFARSLSNDAYYIATRLIQYNLPDIPGQTVVSHHQVSNTYRETNHSDPDGYFAKWGYDMNQFNDLISYYYNNLKDSGLIYGRDNSNVPQTTVLSVNNEKAIFVPLVAFDESNNKTDIQNRGLANNTPWQFDQQKDFDGHVYYRVSTNEWVMDSYVTNHS